VSNGVYIFYNNDLYDNSKNSIKQSTDPFDGKEKDNSTKIDLREKENINYFKSLFDPKKITIFNQSLKPIKVRIKATTSGSEDYFNIGVNCHDSWVRGNETYLIEIVIATTSFKYYVKNGLYYFIQNILFDSDGNQLNYTSDQFSNKNTKSNESDKNFPGSTGNILVSNKYGNTVLVKISTKGIGCAKWFKLQSNQTDTLIREKEEFEMCVSFDCTLDNFLKYKVTSPVSLAIEQGNALRDLNTGLLILPIDSVNFDANQDACLITPGGITIINYSNTRMMVRISSKGYGSEEFFPLDPGQSDTWSRKESGYYQMQYQLNVNLNGPIVLVKSGYCYVITPNYLVTFIDGSPAPVSYDNFNCYDGSNNNNISPSSDTYIFPSENSSYRRVDNQIIVYNESGLEIRVRIKSKDKPTEELYPISDNTYESWTRSAGSYLAEIVTKDGPSFRYYLESYNSYVFSSNFELKETKNNLKVNLTTDVFDTPKKHVVVENNIISIVNHTSDIISVRVKTQGFGSEDYFDVNAWSTEDWTRREETNLMELIHGKNRYRFFVKTKCQYIYLGQGCLADSNSNIEVPQTKDQFYSYENSNENNSEKLRYFDDKEPVMSGNQFTDCYFPPKIRIINSEDDKGNLKKPHFKSHGESGLDTYGIKFKRASEIFKSKYYLFKDSIEVDDVTQGGVGDCWLISAIAALCVRTDLVQKIFKTKSANKEGFYEVYYYENGEKKIMFVDDYFPVISYYGSDYSFKFAKPNGEELWVLLLEKAFAKYEGGYSNINGGLINNAFTFFTGGVCKYIHDLKSSWDELCSALRRGNILAAGSKNGRDTDFSYGNIAQGHGYSILDAKEYNDYNKRIKLIKLRNPWGQKEWTGEYSDESSLWTPKLKEYFNAQEAFGDNGVFFMKYEDFSKEFAYAVICCV